jgi:RNA polymerase-binding protein DksA
LLLLRQRSPSSPPSLQPQPRPQARVHRHPNPSAALLPFLPLPDPHEKNGCRLLFRPGDTLDARSNRHARTRRAWGPCVPAVATDRSLDAAVRGVDRRQVLKKDPKLANNWKAKSAEELTDAEVLAMPDSEYMNDKQMAFFRRKLVQLKTDILNNAGETTEHLREDTVIVPDPADRATIEEEHALELRTRDRERKLLKKIEQSIGRIDAGDYGYCDETGEPIGVGRLLARPTATLSLEAQQRRELKQKMFGD